MLTLLLQRMAPGDLLFYRLRGSPDDVFWSYSCAGRLHERSPGSHSPKGLPSISGSVRGSEPLLLVVGDVSRLTVYANFRWLLCARQ